MNEIYDRLFDCLLVRQSRGVGSANVNAHTTIVAVVKGLAVICLCLIGILGLSVAWIAFIFSADATPGYEAGARIKAVIIAIGTLGVVPTGLYLLFRNRRPAGSDSTDERGRRDQTKCGACGTVFPSRYYLRDAGPRGYICNDCAKSPPDA